MLHKQQTLHSNFRRNLSPAPLCSDWLTRVLLAYTAALYTKHQVKLVHGPQSSPWRLLVLKLNIIPVWFQEIKRCRPASVWRRTRRNRRFSRSASRLWWQNGARAPPPERTRSGPVLGWRSRLMFWNCRESRSGARGCITSLRVSYSNALSSWRY